MKPNTPDTTNPWLDFQGPNLGYVQEMYEVFETDPDSVDPELARLFEQWGPPVFEEAGQVNENGKQAFTAKGYEATDFLYKVAQAVKLAEDIRTNGHLAADIYPLFKRERNGIDFDLKQYGLTTADLKAMPASIISEFIPKKYTNGYEAIEYLKMLYTRTISFELDHVHDLEEKKWLTQMVESTASGFKLPDEKKKRVLKRLTEVDGFEKFLHKTFVGQKRFSIEGVDSLVPLFR